MIASGDLGSHIPLEKVPVTKNRIVQACRALNVITASQLLELAMKYPTLPRVEVAYVSEAVKQRSEAWLLSEESAMGQHPAKSLTVQSVSL